jgi:hypothetical protein
MNAEQLKAQREQTALLRRQLIEEAEALSRQIAPAIERKAAIRDQLYDLDEAVSALDVLITIAERLP